MKEIMCNNCKSNKIQVKYKLKGFNVHECMNCGLRFTYSKEAHDYEEQYFKKEHKEYFSTCNKRFKEEDSKRLKNFKQGLDWIEKFDKKVGGKILDVGCAMGVFLEMCRKRGWGCYGIDISKYSLVQARRDFKRINFKETDLINSSFKANFFDVVSMWDFIEHVYNPSENLEKANKLLKKDGLLFISTINEDSLMNLVADLFYKISFGVIKKPVELLHAHHHLTHFSEKHLREMLEKKGFKILKICKLELPLDGVEGAFIKIKIISFFYFLQKIFNKQYIIHALARKIK